MKTDVIQNLTHTFESHAQQTDDGMEFWLARDIQHLLSASATLRAYSAGLSIIQTTSIINTLIRDNMIIFCIRK